MLKFLSVFLFYFSDSSNNRAIQIIVIFIYMQLSLQDLIITLPFSNPLANRIYLGIWAYCSASMLSGLFL